LNDLERGLTAEQIPLNLAIVNLIFLTQFPSRPDDRPIMLAQFIVSLISKVCGFVALQIVGLQSARQGLVDESCDLLHAECSQYAWK
jgi:hypothetical protein